MEQQEKILFRITDQSDAPVPPLLRGHYAWFRGRSASRIDLEVWTWDGASAFTEVDLRWLEVVRPDEMARFEFLRKHLAETPDGEQRIQDLWDAAEALRTNLTLVVGDYGDLVAWRHGTIYDVLEALGKPSAAIGGAEMSQLFTAWQDFVNAFARLNRTARRQIEA